MQTTKLYVQLYENNIETGLEKKKNSLTQPPPLSGNSWAFDPPTPPEFPIPSVGGVWIFSGTTHFHKVTFSSNSNFQV